MAHTITFIGSENPTCFTSNFLGVTDPALVIESDLRVNKLLGNMIELQANPNGPDVVTVFGRGGSSGLVSRFSSVQVTIFGGVFGSEAVIRNDQLRVSTSSGRVFGFPAEMTITAPSNETDWHDLTLTVEGSLISDSQDSLKGKLTAEIVEKLSWFARVGHTHLRIAEISLRRVLQKLTATMNDFDDAAQDTTYAKNAILTAYYPVRAAQTTLVEIEHVIDRYNLQDIADTLDGLCTEQHCECKRMAGEVCGSCTIPQHLPQCPTLCVVSNTICRSVRQSAVESLEGVTTESKELLQQLIDAQSDLVSAETAARRAELESELYLQKRDLLNASLAMLRNEYDTAVKYYNRTIEEVAPSLRIYESGKRNDFQNVLQINNVTFSTQLTDDPTSLLLNINFQTHIGDNAEQYREEYIYISTQSEGINFERIASDMVKDAIAGIE